MTVKMSNVAAIVGLTCILISPCYATSHIFVMSDKGDVWLVSDTLEVNRDYSYYLKRDIVTKATVCKVSLERGRIVFDAGFFTDAAQMRSAVLALPSRDVDVVAENTKPILKQYSWNPPTVPIDPHLIAHAAGIIQVVNGVFSADLIELATDLQTFNPLVVRPPITAGIPHGFGPVVDTERHAAETDSNIRLKISEHPEAELLRMVKEATHLDPDSIGPPFTVLVLHKDGTVSDYSSKPVCTIPENARATP